LEFLEEADIDADITLADLEYFRNIVEGEWFPREEKQGINLAANLVDHPQHVGGYFAGAFNETVQGLFESLGIFLTDGLRRHGAWPLTKAQDRCQYMVLSPTEGQNRKILGSMKEKNLSLREAGPPSA